MFMMDLRVSEGKYGNVAAYVLRLFEPFPASEGTFLIFGWWGGFETTIETVGFEKSAESRVSPPEFYIFISFGPFLYCLEQ